MRSGFGRLAATVAMAIVLLAAGAMAPGAVADARLTLTTWRIEPSTVKENAPWTVKLWVGNLGADALKIGRAHV